MSYLPGCTVRGALGRGVLGWLAVVLGLVVSISLSDWVFAGSGPRQALRAVAMSALVMSAVLVLCRLDRRRLASIGLPTEPRAIIRSSTLGVLVGCASGLLVWAPAVAVGWIVVDGIDPLRWLGFIVVGGFTLLLFEAVPEEIALRGYAWATVREGAGSTAATLVLVLLFPLTAPAAGVVLAIFGDPGPIVPGGDAIAYGVQLTIFGLALIAARTLPVRAPVLVAVGFHWTSLMITRTVIRDVGWTVQFVEPDALALVLVQAAFGGLIFVAFRSVLTRRGAGSRAEADL